MYIVLSPRSQLHTVMLRTNRKARILGIYIIFMRFEQNDFKILIFIFLKSPTHILIKLPLISKFVFKNMHVCVTFQK